MKLAVDPLTVVGWLALAVVKDSLTVYLIFFKIPFIEGSIFKLKASLTMFHTIQCITFIEMPFFVSKFAINLIVLITYKHLFFPLVV